MTFIELDGTNHRARLRGRILENGCDSLMDHELIEYILALAIPRQDTKPIAKRLLNEFGDIGALLAADAKTIMVAGKIGASAAAALKTVQGTALRMLQSKIKKESIISNWDSLMDYLRADMAFLYKERVRVLFLNTQNILIRDEIMAEGTINESALHVREVMRRALELSASSLIIVHNHPSGDPKPSKPDIIITRSLIEAGRHLSIQILDHLIIGHQGISSMRKDGLI